MEMALTQVKPSTGTEISAPMTRLLQMLGSQRVLQVQALIFRSQVIAAPGQPVLAGDMLLATIEAWAEVLEDVPTAQLDRIYKAAVHAKTNGYPINALDLRAEWNKLTDNGVDACLFTEKQPPWEDYAWEKDTVGRWVRVHTINYQTGLYSYNSETRYEAGERNRQVWAVYREQGTEAALAEVAKYYEPTDGLVQLTTPHPG
jgi:hypothetical protein